MQQVNFKKDKNYQNTEVKRELSTSNMSILWYVIIFHRSIMKLKTKLFLE